MANHYYLIASLPTLEPNGKAPISYEEFLKLCENTVSPSFFKLLSKVTVDTSTMDEEIAQISIIKKWVEFQGVLNRTLCNRRLEKQGKSPMFSREYHVEAEALVSKVMEGKNPLEMENLLIAGQYEYVDSLCAMHYFDDYVLMAYALKLKLLLRKNIFVQEEGKAEFNRLFDYIQNRINSI